MRLPSAVPEAQTMHVVCTFMHSGFYSLPVQISQHVVRMDQGLILMTILCSSAHSDISHTVQAVCSGLLNVLLIFVA